MPVLTTRLTKRVCESTEAPATGSLFLRDGELPGFALRIWPTRRTFILEKRIHGQVRRVTIGPFGPLTVEQARKRAHELIGQIAQGHNPTATRKAQRDELTFGELETLYLARYAVHKKSKKNDVTNFNRHLADWRPRKLSALTRADVATLHAKLGADGHPYGANRVVALVRVMFNLANDWGVFSGPNPAQRVKFFKEEKRDRFVLPTELPKLLAALKEEPNPYIRLSFVTDLLTGARKNEVLTMQWDHLDLDQAVWRIPDTKADRPHLIPLPERKLYLSASPLGQRIAKNLPQMRPCQKCGKEFRSNSPFNCRCASCKRTS
jgi:integrase